MAGEVVILRFVDFDPERAEQMLRCARSFATGYTGGPTGERRGCVYGFGRWSCVAFWTRRRAVVVRELPADEEVPDGR